MTFTHLAVVVGVTEVAETFCHNTLSILCWHVRIIRRCGLSPVHVRLLAWTPCDERERRERLRLGGGQNCSALRPLLPLR